MCFALKSKQALHLAWKKTPTQRQKRTHIHLADINHRRRYVKTHEKAYIKDVANILAVTYKKAQDQLVYFKFPV